jgi:hypothetical protein
MTLVVMMAMIMMMIMMIHNIDVQSVSPLSFQWNGIFKKMYASFATWLCLLWLHTYHIFSF